MIEQQLKLAIEQAENLLKSMANSHRLAILCRLGNGEMTVGELVAFTGLSQSAVSQHLAKLRVLEIVQTRKDQQNVFYSLKSAAAVDVILALQKHYGCNKTTEK